MSATTDLAASASMLAEPTSIQGAQATPAREVSSPHDQASRAGRAAPTSPGVRDRLEELALRCVEYGTGDPAIQEEVGRLAHPGLTPERVWAAFEDLVEAVRLRDGVNDNLVHREAARGGGR